MTFAALPSHARTVGRALLVLPLVVLGVTFVGLLTDFPAEEPLVVKLFLPVPFLLGAGVLILVLRILSRPMEYTVADGLLTVPAHLSPVRVRLHGARVEVAAMGFAWRLAGSSMPGFYLGAFHGRGRRFHAAATHRSRGMFVEGDRMVYVTPADAPAFLEALRQNGAIVPEAGAPPAGYPTSAR